MSLDNKAVPVYYGQYRDEVVSGRIPICRTIAMEMERIDDLIANPGVYYDKDAVEGYRCSDGGISSRKACTFPAKKAWREGTNGAVSRRGW